MGCAGGARDPRPLTSKGAHVDRPDPLSDRTPTSCRGLLWRRSTSDPYPQQPTSKNQRQRNREPDEPS
jgi:hypothetical protein